MSWCHSDDVTTTRTKITLGTTFVNITSTNASPIDHCIYRVVYLDGLQKEGIKTGHIWTR